MEIYEYTQLEINDRTDLLWEMGVFISSYVDADNAFNLYHLHNFYVEVTVSNLDRKIIDVTPFRHGARFDKYIDKIRVNALF